MGDERDGGQLARIPWDCVIVDEVLRTECLEPFTPCLHATIGWHITIADFCVRGRRTGSRTGRARPFGRSSLSGPLADRARPRRPRPADVGPALSEVPRRRTVC